MYYEYALKIVAGSCMGEMASMIPETLEEDKPTMYAYAIL